MNAVGFYDLITKWFKIARPCVIEVKVYATPPADNTWDVCMGFGYWVKTGLPNHTYSSYRVYCTGSALELDYCSGGNVQPNYGNNYSFSFNTNYIGQMILTPTQVIASWLDEGRTSNLSTVSLTNADWNNCFIFLDSGNRKCYYDWIIVRKYMTTEPTISIGDEVSGEFYPEGQVDLKDLYGRDPVGTRDIGAIESEYPPETGTVIINMTGGFQR
jgi:hypothetical protein